MIETIRSSVFREPEGRSSGIFWIGFGAIFFVFAVVNQLQLGRSLRTPLILGVVFVIVGFAEVLPQEKKTDRRWSPDCCCRSRALARHLFPIVPEITSRTVWALLAGTAVYTLYHF